MSKDSVKAKSVCKNEWTRALKYKKPVIPILLHPFEKLRDEVKPKADEIVRKMLDRKKRG